LVRRPRRLLRLALLILVVVAVATALRHEEHGLPGKVQSVPTPPGAKSDRERTPLPDPFAYDPDRRAEFEERAAAGTAHALYARSPGGALATAERTARWRPQIEAAAKQAGVDPNRLEALVFLESAGRPDAMASNDIQGAVGLTQILAETGQNLLGMKVDTARSARYTRRIRRELLRGHLRKVEALQAARAKVDERFDPAKSLQATARYLTMAKQRFKREDLAFVSYHMGMGNLEGVLRAYGVEPGDQNVPYTQIYFDSSPIRHAKAYLKLSAFGDDSSNYLWKLGAAERIMQLSRHDTGKLAALQAAQTAKASAEEVLHPPGTTPRFTTPAELQKAWQEEQLVAFPDNPRVTGLQPDRSMGQLAAKLGKPAALYQGLRPEALATALYVGAEVRALSGESPLIVTSTVRDDEYQKKLVAQNKEATRNYSLHTTGWAFDIARDYRSKVQAKAFQFVIDRLQVLDAIAWVREPDAIHITAAPEGKALLPLLKRVQTDG
jgi:hypothetical protein